MANGLSVSLGYTYNGKEAIDVLVKPLIETPDIKRIFEVRTGIKSGEQIFRVTPPTKKLRANDGCSITYQSGSTITPRKLTTCKFRLAFEQCESAFDDSIFELAKKSGVDEANLSGTELEKIMNQIFAEGLASDMFKVFSFGDASDSDDFYGICEGLWPTLITGLSDYSTTLSRTQFDNDIAFETNEVYNVFKSLWEDADEILKQIPAAQKRIFVTGNVYDAYLAYLESQSNEFGARMEVEGLSVVSFRGIPIVPVYQWDEALADADNPFPAGINKLALYTVPSNHIIGVDALTDDTRYESWFSQDDRVNRWLAEFRMGYNYAHAGLQIIAINE